MKRVYKIRRNSDGKFSTGGLYVGWNTVGKTWELGRLKAHLKMLERRRNSIVLIGIQAPYAYTGCSIVEYEMHESKTVPVVDVGTL